MLLSFSHSWHRLICCLTLNTTPCWMQRGSSRRNSSGRHHTPHARAASTAYMETPVLVRDGACFAPIPPGSCRTCADLSCQRDAQVLPALLSLCLLWLPDTSQEFIHTLRIQRYRWQWVNHEYRRKNCAYQQHRNITSYLVKNLVCLIVTEISS